MPDFILNTFLKLLQTLKDRQYTFQTFADFLKNPIPRVIILRHDVDARKMNSLQTARMENELGITGTYYFRMVPQSYDEEVIKQIAGLGHEIGYHYEDLSLAAERQKTKVKRQRNMAKGAGRRAQGIKTKLQNRKTAKLQNRNDWEEKIATIAIENFRENLARLRRVVPVETICMHGSPLSKYDNRKLWEKYDYRDYGIIGEPYFDINFEEVLYLTDTGRRWDGEAVSVRDKAQSSEHRAQGQERRLPHAAHRKPVPRFHSTFDIINAAKENLLPDKIMITIHPQRWDSRPLPWIKELLWQNVKNVGKKVATAKQRRGLANRL